MRGWIIELHRNGRGFEQTAAGYDSAQAAKSAAARTYKSAIFTHRVRVSLPVDGETYEAVFYPGQRATWRRVPATAQQAA